MSKRLALAALGAAIISAASAGSAWGVATEPACTTPPPVWAGDASSGFNGYQYRHCYTPADIRAAYDVDGVAQLSGDVTNYGQGQTIVLVDSYGSPTAASDLEYFQDKFFPGMPKPDFTQVFPQGNPQYNNVCHSSGRSGPCAAASWSLEANLDVEWSYAIAPKAHIVLLAVPPAETEGVQGFPNLFKAIKWAIDKYPAGTIFSQSFGVTEQTFGGAAATQTAKFDQVYKDAIAKGDTVLASTGDTGTTGTAKQHDESATYPFPTVGWPASSPYVTAVGGTQLQYGWTWDPTSDQPFTVAGATSSYSPENPDYFNWMDGGNTQVVWNETWRGAATGGGPSTIYSRPSWQDGVSSVIGQDARGIPDVAWNAATNGGVLVYITAYPNAEHHGAGWYIVGGTSAASPQVAGVVALANAAREDAGKEPIGYLNPILYDPTKVPSSDYTDVVPTTQGTAASGVLDNNGIWQFGSDGLTVQPGPIAGWPTLTGWDMTTGWGAPIASKFVASLAALP